MATASEDPAHARPESPSPSASLPFALQTHVDRITTFLEGYPIFLEDGTLLQAPSCDDAYTIRNLDSETYNDLLEAISAERFMENYRFKYYYDRTTQIFQVTTGPGSAHANLVHGFRELFRTVQQDVASRYPSAVLHDNGAPFSRLRADRFRLPYSIQPDLSVEFELDPETPNDCRVGPVIVEVCPPLSSRVSPEALSDVVKNWLFFTAGHVLVVFVVKLDKPTQLSDMGDPTKWTAYLEAFARAPDAPTALSKEKLALCNRILVGGRGIQLLPVLDADPILHVEHEDLFTEAELQDIPLDKLDVPFAVDFSVLHRHLVEGIRVQDMQQRRHVEAMAAGKVKVRSQREIEESDEERDDLIRRAGVQTVVIVDRAARRRKMSASGDVTVG